MRLVNIKMEIDKNHEYLTNNTIHTYLSKYLNPVTTLRPKLLIVFKPLREV